MESKSSITRPERYIEDRADRWGFHMSGLKLKAHIEAILASPREAIKQVVDEWLGSAECYEWLERSEVDPLQHMIVVEEDEDEKVGVISHDCASDFLNEAINVYDMSSKMPDGTEIDIPSVKTFDQLYDILIKANPWWIIEMCLIFNGYGDKARCYPDNQYSYEATDAEIGLIKAEINKHLDKMKDVNYSTMPGIPRLPTKMD